jgi:hypothetical protein
VCDLRTAYLWQNGPLSFYRPLRPRDLWLLLLSLLVLVRRLTLPRHPHAVLPELDHILPRSLGLMILALVALTYRRFEMYDPGGYKLPKLHSLVPDTSH